MNEKIKEIYNRAHAEYFGEEYKDCELDILPEDQYFAELLIKETLSELYKTLDDSRDVQVFEGLRLAQQVIRDHFGVE
jgi:hypothetical protein